jgi:hypothetical protein
MGNGGGAQCVSARAHPRLYKSETPLMVSATQGKVQVAFWKGFIPQQQRESLTDRQRCTPASLHHRGGRRRGVPAVAQVMAVIEPAASAGGNGAGKIRYVGKSLKRRRANCGQIDCRAGAFRPGDRGDCRCGIGVVLSPSLAQSRGRNRPCRRQPGSAKAA